MSVALHRVHDIIMINCAHRLRVYVRRRIIRKKSPSGKPLYHIARVGYYVRMNGILPGKLLLRCILTYYIYKHV